tara:strand:+ start:257 stop:1573 length:1317 start_codon:yes stop_codon:yes gene_type:complete
MANTITDQIALDALVVGELSIEEYRTGVLEGRISTPSDDVWQKIWESGLMSRNDTRRARGEAEPTAHARGESRHNDDLLFQASFVAQGLANRAKQKDEEDLAQAGIEEQLSNLTAAEIVAGKGEELVTPTVEDGVPLVEIEEPKEPTPLIGLEASTDQASWETTVLEAPDWTEIIDGQTVTHKGVGKRIHFKDTLTNEAFFINPAEESAALAAVQREIENNRLRLLAQGKQLQFEQDKFDWQVLIQAEQKELDTLDREARDAATARANDLADEALEFERAAYAQQKATAEQELILTKGPGAAAVAKAIQEGARSIDSSLVGKGALDFLGLEGSDKIALDNDGEIAAMGGLSQADKNPDITDSMFDTEVLTKPSVQDGKVGYLPTDEPMGTAFSALDESDRNSVTAIADILGLDLNKRLEGDRTAVPSARGVYANFRRA